MSCVWMLQRGHSGDGCVLVSTLCRYDLRKGDLFVRSWARVRRVRRGSLSSDLLICGGGVCSILLLPLVARCIDTIGVCIWRMFVFMSVVVTVWGSAMGAQFTAPTLFINTPGEGMLLSGSPTLSENDYKPMTYFVCNLTLNSCILFPPTTPPPPSEIFGFIYLQQKHPQHHWYP